MAKIKVRPYPGALSELLKKKAMTQVDAAAATGVDRKTLAKINLGGEVKLETLQNLAKKLHVPVVLFDPPTAELVDDEINQDEHEAPWMHSVMLRKLDAQHFAEMLKDAQRIRWQLNLAVVDEKACGFLEEFEDAVKQFHQHLRIEPREIDEDEADSLRFQLRRLKKAEDVASLFEGLVEHRLTVLGADYLFWESETGDYESSYWIEYKSSRSILLSVEPHGAQPRRVRVSPGSEPPKFAPDASRTVFVDGLQLEIDNQIPRPLPGSAG